MSFLQLTWSVTLSKGIADVRGLTAGLTLAAVGRRGWQWDLSREAWGGAAVPAGGDKGSKRGGENLTAPCSFSSPSLKETQEIFKRTVVGSEGAKHSHQPPVSSAGFWPSLAFDFSRECCRYKDADPVGALRKPTAPEPPRPESKAPESLLLPLFPRLLCS